MNKQIVDIVIRYEHKVRELESIMLICIEMERRGYSVAFTGNYDYKDKRRIIPRLIISPAIYNDGQLLVDIFKYGFKKKIVNLLWEQLMGIKEEESPDGAHNVFGVGRRIVTFCWGNNTRNRLVAAGMQEDKAMVVGQINTDLLHGPLSKSLLTKRELADTYHIDCNSRWNLFISSFAYCELDDFQRGLIKRTYGEKYLNEFAVISEKSRDEVLIWFDKILQKYPNDIFIYRPHPDEAKKSQILIDIERRHPNFRVIAELPLKHWVNASEKIYNWYSTGIIDAVVLEKPNRTIRPLYISEEYDYRIFANSDQIKTYEDFEKDYLSLDCHGGINETIIRDYYYLTDSYAYSRVCDILEEVLKTDKYDIHYTISERFHLGKLYLRRKFVDTISFWEPLARKIHVFNKALIRRESLNRALEAGYEKNVATETEILEMYNRMRAFFS